ncbi:MAG: bifunctional hydroxymethylpyrimidine kinase/phosphomethylpyrimidine kinase [Opitutales bacterium]
MSIALSIAGSDSGGGAGIQADLLTFAAHGVFGLTALTSLTAQNPSGVREVAIIEPAFLRAQLAQLTEFFAIGAIKTGMLANAALARVVADFLVAHPHVPVVVDPVMVASSGATLLEEAAVACIREDVLPRAALITPNLDEAAVLTGDPAPTNREAMLRCANDLASRFGTNVLLKGGHLPGDFLLDVFLPLQGQPFVLETQRINEVDTHGSGCTFSAAIAARLSLGESLAASVRGGWDYLQTALRQPLHVGGRAFISHGAR